MKVADVAVSIGVGICATGSGVIVIQFALTWVNRRADQRVESRSTYLKAKLHQFLDWWSRFVLGPPKRLDHEPMYSCLTASFFLVGFFWLVGGPLPNSVIFTLPPATQITLATIMLVGPAISLYGITLGGPFDVEHITCRLRGRHPHIPLDLRRAYRIGASGTPPLIVCLVYYIYVLVRDTPLNWTGANTIILGFMVLGLTFQWTRFLAENRRINQALPALLAQEAARRRIEGGQ